MILSIEDLVVEYDGVPALRGVNLQVEAGEIVALLGPNGAGKTTTLRAISQLVPTASGDITYCGERLSVKDPADAARAGIAHVAEGRRLFSSMTVESNLRLGAFVRGGKDLDADLAQMYERWPVLGRKRRAMAASLSGGEQQMLAIAQALMSHPRLLLLDEPSFGLAPIIVAELLEFLSRLRDEGLTVLLVEQAVDAALDLADRAYVMSRGQVAVAGTASDIKDTEELEMAYLGRL